MASPGLFDDLVPQTAQPQGLFDDLVPQTKQPYGPPMPPLGAQTGGKGDYGPVSSTITDVINRTVQGAYQWGGNDPKKGTDCSGATCAVAKEYGVNLPRTAIAQYQDKRGKAVNPKALQPGDLVFFETKKDPSRVDKQSGRSVTHVGIYVGNGKFRHQSTDNAPGMTEANLADWQKKMVGAKRFEGMNAERMNGEAFVNKLMGTPQKPVQGPPQPPKDLKRATDQIIESNRLKELQRQKEAVAYESSMPPLQHSTGLENIPLPRGEETPLQRANTAFSGSTRTRYQDTEEGRAFDERMAGIASIVGLPKDLSPTEIGLSLIGIIPGVAMAKGAGAVGRGLAKIPGITKIAKALSTAKTEAQFVKALEGLDTLSASETAYLKNYIESTGGKFTSVDQIPFSPQQPKPTAQFNPVKANVVGSKGYDSGATPDLKAMGTKPSVTTKARLDAGIPTSQKKGAKPAEPIPTVPKAEPKPSVSETPKIETQTPKAPTSETKPVTPKPTPKPPTSTESAPGGLSMASRQAQADEGIGRGPTTIHNRKSRAEQVAEAQKLLDEGHDPTDTMKQLARDRRPATGDEIALISEYRDRLIKKRRELEGKLDNPNTKNQDRQIALEEQARLDDQINDYDLHWDEVKAAGGESLGAIGQIGNRVNYDNLDEVVREAVRRRGVPLYKNEEAKLADAVKGVKQAEKDIATATDVEDALNTVVTKNAGRKPRNIEVVRSEKEATKQALKDTLKKPFSLKSSSQEAVQAFGPFQGLMEAIPEAARHVKKLIELTIEERGLRKLDKNFYDTVRKEFDDLGLTDHDGVKITISDKDIRQVFSGYYGRVKRTVSEAQATVKDLKAQAKLLEQIDEAKAGIPAAKRISRPPSEEVVKLKEILKQTIKTMGADQSPQIRKLKEILAEAEDMLAKKYRKVKKPVEIDSAAVTALKNKISLVRKEMNLSDKIDILEDQIRTGTLDAVTKKPTLTNARIEDLEHILKSRRAKVRAMTQSMGPITLPKFTEGWGRNMQLLNVSSRIIDLTANTAKMMAHITEAPLRSLISMAAPNVAGREQFHSITALFRKENVTKTLRDLADVWKGTDIDTLEKFGKSGGLGTKLAGTTDVLFKRVYTNMAYDDFATAMAQKEFGINQFQRGPKAFGERRAAIYKQLATGADGPLTASEVRAANVIAHDWALRQTYNSDNLLGKGIDRVKTIGNEIKKAPKGSPLYAAQRDEADALVTFIDINTRFTKVIANVALEKANRTAGLGMIEAAYRTIKHGGKPIAAEEMRLIADLAAKGMTGLAMYKVGQTYYDNLSDNGTIKIGNVTVLKPNLITTKGGRRILKWEFFPDLAGGIDANQIGAWAGPMLHGMTTRYIEKSGLTDPQKKALYSSYLANELVSTPVAGNVKETLNVFLEPGSNPGEKLSEWTGGMIARNTTPGILNDIATRQDKMQTGTDLRKTTGFWDEFIKRMPKIPNGPSWLPNRQQLPSNQK